MAWTTDEDGNPYWLDDYTEEPVAPIEPEFSGIYPDGEGGWIDMDGNAVYENGQPVLQVDDNQTEAEVARLLRLNNGEPQGLTVDDNQTEAEVARLIRQAGGQSGLGNISPGSEVSSGNSNSIIDSLLKQLKSKDGDWDWSKLLGLGAGALGLVDAATSKPQNAATMAELRAGMSKTNEPAPWTEADLAFGKRPMQTGSALERIYAADMKSPETPGKAYAEGGEVEGALSQAFAGAVMGDDGGQSDLVEARLSPGEYVLDAETVSALGDGNTAAGIAKLDELRARLRAEKRSASIDEIPPQAQGPLSYMQGA